MLSLLTSTGTTSVEQQVPTALSIPWQHETCASPRDRTEVDAKIFGFAARLGGVPTDMDSDLAPELPRVIRTPLVESFLESTGSVTAGRAAPDRLHSIGHVGEVDDIAHGLFYTAQ